MGIIGQVGCLEHHEVIIPDGLSALSFNDGSKLLTSELTKRLGLTWAGEQVTKGWFESVDGS